MFAGATGRQMSLDELYVLGERIWNLTRLFNLKAGLRKEDEDLPVRFKTEPLPDGPAAGHLFTEEDIARLRADYYAVRGWDEHGVPDRRSSPRSGWNIPSCKARTPHHKGTKARRALIYLCVFVVKNQG